MVAKVYKHPLDTKEITDYEQIENYNGRGDLDLSETNIASLPENLKVGGNLDLHDTPIASLPEGLKVKGYLDLRNTPITSLPKNLRVGGDLNLSGTNITLLPEDLKVGGYITLQNGKSIKFKEYLEKQNSQKNSSKSTTRLSKVLTKLDKKQTRLSKVLNMLLSNTVCASKIDSYFEKVFKSKGLDDISFNVLNEEDGTYTLEIFFFKDKINDFAVSDFEKRKDDLLKALQNSNVINVISDWSNPVEDENTYQVYLQFEGKTSRRKVVNTIISKS